MIVISPERFNTEMSGGLFNTFPSTSISHGPVTSLVNVRLILLSVWRSISHSGTLVLVALSTNFIGYGLTGLTRRFLVYPSRVVWPASLATIALNVSDSNHHFRRYALISLILAACLPHGGKPTCSRPDHLEDEVVHVLLRRHVRLLLVPQLHHPGYILLHWMTWIAPNNVNLAAVTGNVRGLGLNPFSTWDWNQLTVAGDPLINPFYSIFNYFLGTLIAAPITLAVWYANTWYTAYIAINDNHVWDNTGSRYKVLNVVDKDSTFDEAGYKAYSLPPRMPLT